VQDVFYRGISWLNFFLSRDSSSFRDSWLGTLFVSDDRIEIFKTSNKKLLKKFQNTKILFGPQRAISGDQPKPPFNLGDTDVSTGLIFVKLESPDELTFSVLVFKFYCGTFFKWKWRKFSLLSHCTLFGWSRVACGHPSPLAWKTTLPSFPTSCWALMGGCKETIHVRCSHELPVIPHLCSWHCESNCVSHSASNRK